MVAAVCPWHEHHEAAAVEIERRLDRGERIATPAPALVEAYAVLTRLPQPHRLAPDDAWTILKGNFVDQATVMALDSAAYVQALDAATASDTAGGRTYDLIIGECARLAGASALLTFNSRHFHPGPTGVEVVTPNTRR
jgi:predicted nucleic acid-binding protein